MKLGGVLRSLCASAFSFAAVTAMAGILPLTNADSCSQPHHNAPQIAFTMASFGPGTLDNICGMAVFNAKALGFGAVTLVPAKVFDGQKTIGEGTVTREELLRCLGKIWDSGFNIIYQPHLESDFIVHPDHPVIWRADFDFAPDAAYESLNFDAFFEFLDSHKSELAMGARQIDITVSAELEKSTTKFPAQWHGLVDRLRGRLKSLGLDGIVHIGFNPNWYPRPSFDGSKQNCVDFQNFVQSLDYVAPSFYGDWSRMFTSDGHTPRGRAQVDELKVELMKRLTYYPQNRCSVPQMAMKPFSIGEFGIGGDFQHAEKDDWALLQRPDFMAKRRAVYSNIIDWAMGQTSISAAPRTVNIWTGGVFDPVGVYPFGEKVVDSEIAKLFGDYRDWRCRVFRP